jgi:alpha-L-fucosidase
MNAWHSSQDRVWYETPPPNNPKFVENWYLRCKELIDKYHPDQLYFDDTGLPLEQTGLDIAAHFYNSNIAEHGGQNEAVLNGKKLPPDHRAALVEDYERGVSDSILPDPWQTDTCIGVWHYDRSIYEKHRYKTVGQVVRMLADIVSKNGNLMLSVPLQRDGQPDADEIKIVSEIGAWLKVNGDAIYATRPWKIYGEGPSTVVAEKGQFDGQTDVSKKPFTVEDIRFTQSKDGKTLYAIVLEIPKDGKVSIKSLAANSPNWPGKIGSVRLVGGDKLKFTRDETGLHVLLPEKFAGKIAFALKVRP